MNELINQTNNERFILFPIKYDEIWKMYKQQVANFWTVEEVNLESDMRDWEKLNDNEKKFIKYVLAFFSNADGIVSENLILNFAKIITIPEARFFYGFQIAMENIHNEMYSVLIDTYIKDKEEKNYLFRAIENINVVKKKAEWALKWINNDDILEKKIIAFIIVEGLFFSGSFCAIYWLKKRGLMPGLCFSNELISRDEACHCLFGCLMYNYLPNRLDYETIKNMFVDALEIEKEFITESISVNLIGMNDLLMIQYIKFVCDYWVSYLNYPKIYNVENPFPWMSMISLQRKTNFFEAKLSEYQKSTVMSQSMNFNLNDEF